MMLTPHGHLVGREDLLALDRQVALADVHQDALDRGRPLEPALLRRDLVPAGLQHLRELAVLVPQPPVRVLDDELLALLGDGWSWQLLLL